MENRKLVALTFDDGPSNVTEKVLNILEEHHAIGTFFLIGNLITPDKYHLMKRQIAMGCEIANHSFTHSDMSTMTSEVIKDEISKTTALIKDVVSVEPKFFRPPYISLSDTMYSSIELPFICGVDSVDWDPKVTADERYQNVLNKVTDGAIVLMHDLENNDATIEALPRIIESLREKGYEFVTTSQLFAEKNVNPHVAHKLWSNVLED